MKKYYVIFQGGKEQFITAKDPKEACQKVRKMLYKYIIDHPIIGYYEI